MENWKSFSALILCVTVGAIVWWGTLFQPEDAVPELARLRSANWRERIDLNTATIGELVSLPAIAEKRAGRIDQFRKKHGKFALADTSRLLEVKYIYPKVIEIIRPYLLGNKDNNKTEPDKK